MKLIRYRFTVGITFIAPIISQSSGALRLGLDAAMLRDRNGTPAIPGTLIQGNLRHAWDALFKDTLGLGQESKDGSPQRGHLNFSEFWVYSSGKRFADLRYRIKIDEKTGKVETGAIQTIESLFPAGEPVKFTGDIFGWFADDQQAEVFKIKISKGLYNMATAGAFNGVGFGRVKTVELCCTKIKPATMDYHATGDQIGLMLKPDRAFCFSRHRAGNNTPFNEDIKRDKPGLDNRYVSEDFIPGGAIKGSIATLLQLLSDRNKGDDADCHPDFPLLSQHLDQIVFTHAQPAVVGQHTCKRGHALPKSVVMADDKFFDVARKDKPGLINKKAPAFSTDWKPKDWTAAGSDKRLNLPAYLDDSRSLILHTEIDAETGASKDHQLFSIEAVNPKDHEWLANITLPKDIDANARQALYEELKRLFSLGLHWLGKTEASAGVALTAPFAVPGAHAFTPGQQAITITLLSSACLLPVVSADKTVQPTNGSKELLKAYRASWEKLSGGSLELHHFYAEQQLVGGHYLHERFGKGKPYNPRIFTTAGSVFVFKVKNPAQAKTLLDNWSKYGLPQLEGFSDNWRENPYIAQNGYGEIAVNLTTVPEPGKNEWQPIKEITV
jgi:hypothetical protein